ncbi:MAG: hypothetical protein GY937_11605 [bacterium]|nr:hypothetical protein [bacterium]
MTRRIAPVMVFVLALALLFAFSLPAWAIPMGNFFAGPHSNGAIPPATTPQATGSVTLGSPTYSYSNTLTTPSEVTSDASLSGTLALKSFSVTADLSQARIGGFLGTLDPAELYIGASVGFDFDNDVPTFASVSGLITSTVPGGSATLNGLVAIVPIAAAGSSSSTIAGLNAGFCAAFPAFCFSFSASSTTSAMQTLSFSTPTINIPATNAPPIGGGWTAVLAVDMTASNDQSPTQISLSDFTVSIHTVPEPGSGLLLATALVALTVVGRQSLH